MTKRDFVAIAEVIRQAHLQYGGDSFVDADDILEYVSRALANHCADHNDKFDRDRFLRACRIADFEELHELDRIRASVACE